ncbi:MAG: CopG family transcriptional regulator [Burkholderiaceae bacterium]
MPTTLDIDPDVLAAARELAGRRGVPIGRVLSELARQTLVSGSDAVVPREPAPSF